MHTHRRCPSNASHRCAPTHTPSRTHPLPSNVSVDASRAYMCVCPLKCACECVCVHALRQPCWIWAGCRRVLKHTRSLILPPRLGVWSLQNLFQQDSPLQTCTCIFLALTEFIVPGLMSPLSASGGTAKCVCL